MNALAPPLTLDDVADVVRSLRSKGIYLWSENGQLRYKTTNGGLDVGERTLLKDRKEQILAFFAAAARAEVSKPTFELYPQLDRAPLSFSQLAHWHLYQLDERPSLSLLLTAIRLEGKLDVEALRSSLTQMLHRHSALRTRIVVCDGVPVQHITAPCDWALPVIDLTAVPTDARDSEAKRLIEEAMLEPLDVAGGSPLFRTQLLRLGDEEHVLALCVEHMIADGFSMKILHHELFAAYLQLFKGQPLSLPPPSLQFYEYALWQQKNHSSWLDRHGAYWREQQARQQRARFAGYEHTAPAISQGWWGHMFRIDEDLTSKLRSWSRERRTTLAMTVLTAYIATVLRWCSVSEAMIAFEIDGRNRPEIEGSFGYFASALYIHAQILEADCFGDLVERVKQEYFKAWEHADASYLEAQSPRPDFTRNGLFNWIPQSSKIEPPTFSGPQDDITCSQFPLGDIRVKRFLRDTEPVSAFVENHDHIQGVIQFPLDHFSLQTIERFAQNILVSIRALLQQPGARINDIPLT